LGFVVFEIVVSFVVSFYLVAFVRFSSVYACITKRRLS